MSGGRKDKKAAVEQAPRIVAKRALNDTERVLASSQCHESQAKIGRGISEKRSGWPFFC